MFKTFLFMSFATLVLFSFVIGAKCSGIGSFQSRCSSYCTGTEGDGYEVGKSYLYRYNGATELQIQGANDPQALEHTVLTISTNVQVQPLSSCDYILQLSDVSLTNKYVKSFNSFKLNETVRQYDEFATYLEKNILHFAIQDGKIKTLCPASEEPVWVLNIKRGILSSLQNTMADKTQDEIVYETDVIGDCETSYKLIDEDPITIIKKKKLDSCIHRVDRSMFWQSLPYDMSKSKYSLPLLRSSHECIQTFFDNGLLNTSTCDEKHLLQPFSNGENGAVTNIVQTLEFISDSMNNNIEETTQSAFGPRTGIIFEHVKTKSISKEDERKIIKILQEIEENSIHGIKTEVPQLFRKLVNHLRQMTPEQIFSLKKNVSSPQKRKFLLDAIPLMLNANGVHVIKTLYNLGQISHEQMHSWIMSMMFVKEPHRDIVEALIPLLDGDTKVPTYLTLSSIIHKYCINNNCDNDIYISNVMKIMEENLGKKCVAKSAVHHKNILLSLKAIGNAGITFDKNRLIACYQNNDNGLDIRLGALSAYRRMNCDAGNVQHLINLLADHTEHTEIRIAAYLRIMQCPTYSIFQKIKDILKTEESNQVGSFMWTHLTNLQETSSKWKKPIQDLIRSDFLANKFSTDMRKFSRNYELSSFSEDWNMGGSVDSNVIFSPESYLPRSVMLNLTLDLFGESVNLFELGGRFEGFEDMVEDMFGPHGRFPENSVKSILEQFRNETEQTNAKHNMIGDKFRSSGKTLNKQPKASMYARLFGNEFTFGQFENFNEKLNEEEKRNSGDFSVMDTIAKLFRENNLEYTKSFTFMDSKFSTSTSVGLPVELSLQGSATVSLTLNGKLNLAQIQDCKFEVEGKVHPSAAVQLEGIMSLDAFVTKSALQITGTLQSNTYLDGHVKIDKGKLVDVKLHVPKKQMDLINVQSSLFLIQDEDSHKLKGVTENSENSRVCTSDWFGQFTGLQLCSDMYYANASMNLDAPFFPLTGPFRYAARVSKVDHFDSYVFQFSSKSPSPSFSSYETSLLIDTPNSQIDRKLNFVYNLNLSDLSFSTKLLSPFLSLGLNTQITNNKDKLGFRFDTSHNNKKFLQMETSLKMSRHQNQNHCQPYLVLYYSDKMIASITGSLSFSHDSKFNLEMNIDGDYMEPITFAGNLNMKQPNNWQVSGNVLSSMINGDFSANFHKQDDSISVKAISNYIAQGTLENMAFFFKLQSTRKGILSRDVFHIDFSSSQFKNYNSELYLSSERSKNEFHHKATVKRGEINWELRQLYQLRKANGHYNDYNFAFLCSLSCAPVGIDYRVSVSHQVISSNRNIKVLLKLNDIQKLELLSNYTNNRTNDLSLQSLDLQLYYPKIRWEINAFRQEFQTKQYQISLKLNQIVGTKTKTYLSTSGQYRIHNNSEIKQSWNGVLELPQLKKRGQSHWKLISSMNLTSHQIQYQGKFNTESGPYELNFQINSKIFLLELSQKEKLLFYIDNLRTLKNKNLKIGLNIHQHFEFSYDSGSFNTNSNFDVKFYWDKEKDLNKKLSFKFEQILNREQQTHMVLEYPNQKIICLLELKSNEFTMNVTWGVDKSKQILLRLNGFLALDNGSLSILLHTPFRYLERQHLSIVYYLTDNNAQLQLKVQALEHQISFLAGGSRHPNSVNGYLQANTTSSLVSNVDVMVGHSREDNRHLSDQSLIVNNEATIKFNKHIIQIKSKLDLSGGDDGTTSAICEIQSPTKSIRPITMTYKSTSDESDGSHRISGLINWASDKSISALMTLHKQGFRFDLKTPFHHMEDTLMHYTYSVNPNRISVESQLNLLRQKNSFLLDYGNSESLANATISMKSHALGEYEIYMEHSNIVTTPTFYNEHFQITKNGNVVFMCYMKGSLYSRNHIQLTNYFQFEDNFNGSLNIHHDVSNASVFSNNSLAFGWQGEQYNTYVNVHINKNPNFTSSLISVGLPNDYSLYCDLNFQSYSNMTHLFIINMPSREFTVLFANMYEKDKLEMEMFILENENKLFVLNIDYNEIEREKQVQINMFNIWSKPVSLALALNHTRATSQSFIVDNTLKASLTYGSKDTITLIGSYSVFLIMPFQFNATISTPFTDDISVQYSIENELLLKVSGPFGGKYELNASREYDYSTMDMKILTNIPNYEKIFYKHNSANKKILFQIEINDNKFTIDLENKNTRTNTNIIVVFMQDINNQTLMNGLFRVTNSNSDNKFDGNVELKYETESYLGNHHISTTITPESLSMGFVAEHSNQNAESIDDNRGLKCEFSAESWFKTLEDATQRGVSVLWTSNVKTLPQAVTLLIEKTPNGLALNSTLVSNNDRMSMNVTSDIYPGELKVNVDVASPKAYLGVLSGVLTYRSNRDSHTFLTTFKKHNFEYFSVAYTKTLSQTNLLVLTARNKVLISSNHCWDVNVEMWSRKLRIYDRIAKFHAKFAAEDDDWNINCSMDTKTSGNNTIIFTKRNGSLRIETLITSMDLNVVGGLQSTDNNDKYNTFHFDIDFQRSKHSLSGVYSDKSVTALYNDFMLTAYYTTRTLNIDLTKNKEKYLMLDMKLGNNAELFKIIMHHKNDIYDMRASANQLDFNIIAEKNKIPIIQFSTKLEQTNEMWSVSANYVNVFMRPGFREIRALVLVDFPEKQFNATLTRESTLSFSVFADFPKVKGQQFSTLFNLTSEFQKVKSYLVFLDVNLKQLYVKGNLKWNTNNFENNVALLSYISKQDDTFTIKIIPEYNSLKSNFGFSLNSNIIEIICEVPVKKLHFFLLRNEILLGKNITLFGKLDEHYGKLELVYEKDNNNINAQLRANSSFHGNSHVLLQHKNNNNLILDVVLNENNYFHCKYNFVDLFTVDLDIKAENFKMMVGTTWMTENYRAHFTLDTEVKKLDAIIDIDKYFSYGNGVFQINYDKYGVAWSSSGKLSMSDPSVNKQFNMKVIHANRTENFVIMLNRNINSYLGYSLIETSFRNYERIELETVIDLNPNDLISNMKFEWPSDKIILKYSAKMDEESVSSALLLVSPLTDEPFEAHLDLKCTEANAALSTSCSLGSKRNVTLAAHYQKGSDVKVELFSPWPGYTEVLVHATVDSSKNTAKFYFEKENVATELNGHMKQVGKNLLIEMKLSNPVMDSPMGNENYVVTVDMNLDSVTLSGSAKIIAGRSNSEPINVNIALQPDHVFLTIVSNDHDEPIDIKGSYASNADRYTLETKAAWKTSVVYFNASFSKHRLVLDVNVNDTIYTGFSFNKRNRLRTKMYDLDIYFPRKSSLVSLKTEFSKHNSANSNNINLQLTTPFARMRNLNITTKYNRGSLDTALNCNINNVLLNVQNQLRISREHFNMNTTLTTPNYSWSNEVALKDWTLGSVSIKNNNKNYIYVQFKFADKGYFKYGVQDTKEIDVAYYIDKKSNRCQLEGILFKKDIKFQLNFSNNSSRYLDMVESLRFEFGKLQMHVLRDNKKFLLNVDGVFLLRIEFRNGFEFEMNSPSHGNIKLQTSLLDSKQSMNVTINSIELSTYFTDDVRIIQVIQNKKTHKLTFRNKNSVQELAIETPLLNLDSPLLITNSFKTMNQNADWKVTIKRNDNIEFQFDFKFAIIQNGYNFNLNTEVFKLKFLSLNSQLQLEKESVKGYLTCEHEYFFVYYLKLHLDHSETYKGTLPIVSEIMVNSSSFGVLELNSVLQKDSYVVHLDVEENKKSIRYISFESKMSRDNRYTLNWLAPDLPVTSIHFEFEKKPNETFNLALHSNVTFTIDMITGFLRLDAALNADELSVQEEHFYHHHTELIIKVPFKLSTDYEMQVTLQTDNVDVYGMRGVFRNRNGRFQLIALSTYEKVKTGFNIDLVRSPFTLEAELHLPSQQNLVDVHLQGYWLPGEDVLNYIQFKEYRAEVKANALNNPKHKHLKVKVILPIEGFENWSLHLNYQHDTQLRYTSTFYYPGLAREIGFDLGYYCPKFSQCNFTTTLSLPHEDSSFNYVHVKFANVFNDFVDIIFDYNKNSMHLNYSYYYDFLDRTQIQNHLTFQFNHESLLSFKYNLENNVTETGIVVKDKSVYYLHNDKNKERLLKINLGSPHFIHYRINGNPMFLNISLDDNDKNIQIATSNDYIIYLKTKLSSNSLTLQLMSDEARVAWNKKTFAIQLKSTERYNEGLTSKFSRTSLKLEVLKRSIEFMRSENISSSLDSNHITHSHYQINWDPNLNPELSSALTFTLQKGAFGVNIKHFEFKNDLAIQFVLKEVSPLHVMTKIKYSPRLEDLVTFQVKCNVHSKEYSFSAKHLASKINHRLVIRDVRKTRFLFLNAQVTLQYLEQEAENRERKITGFVEIDPSTLSIHLGANTSRNHISVASTLLKQQHKRHSNINGLLLQLAISDEEPLTLRITMEPEPSLNVDLSYGNTRKYSMVTSVPSPKEITSKLIHEIYGVQVTDLLFALKLNSSQLLWSKIEWRTDVWPTFKSAILNKYQNGFYVVEAMINDTMDIFEDDVGQTLLHHIQEVRSTGFPITQSKIANVYGTVESCFVTARNYLRTHPTYSKYESKINSTIENVLESYKNFELYINNIIEEISKSAVPYTKIVKKFSELCHGIKNVAQMKKNFKLNLLMTLDKVKKSMHKINVIFIEHLESLDEYAKHLQNVLMEMTEPCLNALDDLVVYFEQRLTILQLTVLEILDTLQNYVMDLKESKWILNTMASSMRWLEEQHLLNVIQPIQDRIEDILEVFIEDFKVFVEYYKPYLDAMSEAVLGKYKSLNQLPAIIEMKNITNKMYERSIWIWKYHNMTQHIEYILENNVSQLDDVFFSLTKYLNQDSDSEFESDSGQSDYVFRPDLGMIELKQKLPVEWHGFNELPRFEQHPVYVKLKTHFSRLFQVKKYHDDLIEAMYSYAFGNPTKVLYPTAKLGLIIEDRHYMTFNEKHFNFKGNCSYILASDFARQTFSLAINYNNKTKKSFTFISDNIWKIKIQGDQSVSLNDEAIELPLTVGNSTVTRTEHSILLENRNGLTFWCSTRYNYCALRLSGWYFGKTGGLFGRLDNEPLTDISLPDGRKAGDIASFGSGWEVSDDGEKCDDDPSVGSLPSPTSSPPSSAFLGIIADNMCTTVFNSLSKCFSRIDPTPYLAICKSDSMVHHSMICSSVAAYVAQCRQFSVTMAMPNYCVYCPLTKTTKLEANEVKVYDGNNYQTSDVVVIVHESDMKLLNKSLPLFSQFDAKLNELNITRNRYAIVGYGNVDVPKPYLHTKQGKTWFDGNAFENTLRKLAETSKQTDDINMSMYETLQFATQLDFRPAVFRTFILLQSQFSNENNQFSEMLDLLGDADIKLHVLKPKIFHENNIHTLGVDGEGHHFTNTIEDDNRKFHVKNDLTDANSLLALDLNGTVFDIDRMLDKDGENLSSVWVQSIVNSMKPTCQICTCTANEDNVSKLVCRKCLSPSVKQLLLEYESNSIRFSDENEDNIYENIKK